MTLLSQQATSCLSTKKRAYLTNKLRIQGVIHSLCLYITGVQKYLDVPLPNPITLSVDGGFMIKYNELGGDGISYPLFFLSINSPISEIGLPL